MGLCLESGTAKTAPAPKILQLLLAPTENSRSLVPLYTEALQLCVHLGPIPEDAECKGSQQTPWVLLWHSSLSEEVKRGVNSLHVVFFPVVQASRTVVWEGKRAFQWGGGNWQQEPRQLPGTHLPPASILHLSASAVKVAVWPCN